MTIRSAFVSTIGVALCLTFGCSKSSTTQASFGSSSDSSSSPFKSSSKSSGAADAKESEETAYQRDVRNHTAQLAQSMDDQDLASFQHDLAEIAEGYGIADWEQAMDTYVAIGRGLADSGLDAGSVRRFAIELANEDHGRLALVRSGYEGQRDR